MSETTLLLNAYYERLYNRLEADRDLLTQEIENRLHTEAAERDFGFLGTEKYLAYRDACIAFLEERIEAYNPVGLQYTFDNSARKRAATLELQLDWYDSTEEFQTLLKTAQSKSQAVISEQMLDELADEIIAELGAFPDNSIISAYRAKPAISKLPDYIVACAIETAIRIDA